MVAVLVITLGCSVKWKGIQVQQVLLAVIRDGVRPCSKESVSGSRIRSANKSARLSCVGHVQFLSEPSGILTWAKIMLQSLPKMRKLPRVYREAFAFTGKTTIQVHGTFSKHWRKDDQNLIFVQVPLLPSNF